MTRLLSIIMTMLLIITFVPVADRVTEAASSAAPTGKLIAEKLAFAYSDATGQRLLGLESSKPKRFVKAIRTPGKSVDITYVKHQKESARSNGRQTEGNFDRDGGELYSIIDGKVKHNDSVLLAETDAFQGHTFLSYTPVSQGTFSKAVIAQIEKQRKRKVVKQGLIGQASPDVRVGLVEFAKAKGQKPLASLVLTTKQGPLFVDFVGVDDPSSTWRVDDGGSIEPDHFNMIFITKSQQGYSLAYEWASSEGYSLEVLQQQGSKLKSVLQGGRYTAAE